MATTYEFIEDPQNNRFKFIEKVNGQFDEGQWYAKGTALLEVDGSKVVVTLSPDSSPIRISPASITAPTFGTTEELYDKLSAIFY